MSEPVFYDCEASALEGVPIEIGWAWLDGVTDAIVSEAHLIRPPADWRIDDLWDADAQKLHGITRSELRRDGKPVWEIAQRMNAALACRELHADDPHDEAWLRQVFDAAGVDPAFTIRRVDARVLIAQRAAKIGLGEDAFTRVKAEANALAPRRHRAEADACHLAIRWKLVTLAL